MKDEAAPMIVIRPGADRGALLSSRMTGGVGFGDDPRAGLLLEEPAPNRLDLSWGGTRRVRTATLSPCESPGCAGPSMKSKRRPMGPVLGRGIQDRSSNSPREHEAGRLWDALWFRASCRFSLGCSRGALQLHHRGK